MEERNMSSYRLETLLVHAGESPEKGTGASVPPVFQSTSFAQDTAEDLEQIFSGRKSGYIYTRNGNPTVTALELKMTQLESGMGSVATSSGMAAITATAMTLAGEGDEIVAGRSLYGGNHGKSTVGCSRPARDSLSGERGVNPVCCR